MGVTTMRDWWSTMDAGMGVTTMRDWWSTMDARSALGVQTGVNTVCSVCGMFFQCQVHDRFLVTSVRVRVWVFRNDCMSLLRSPLTIWAQLNYDNQRP